MNLQSLLQQIGLLLNDPSNTRWTTDVLTTRINLAQTEIQGQTNAIKTTITTNIVINDAGYGISSDVMDVLAVYVTDTGGNITAVKGISVEELNFLYPNWIQFSPGTPIFYRWQATINEVDLIPAPNYSVSNGLFISTSKKPADLVNLTDIPFDSYSPMIPYHMAIVHWVVAHCWMDNGDPESLAKSKFHSSGLLDSPGEYENQIKRIIARFDAPKDLTPRILWKPQGGRLGSSALLSKSQLL